MVNPIQQPNKLSMQGVSRLSVLLFIISVIALSAGWYMMNLAKQDEVEILTREGVINKIQDLNRLQTVAFSIDTVITSQKQGNWYNLWQDQQKGLFVAHGRVIAGVDLNKLTSEQVQVSEDGKTVNITIPKAEVFDVYLDDIEVYDLSTGMFGLMKADPEIFNQAQISGKRQVLKTACDAQIMTMALDNAQKQIQALFGLAGAAVTVDNQGVSDCMIMPAN